MLPAVTARVAEALPPAPPSFDVTAWVVLVKVPVLLVVTFTLKMQAADAARVAPDRETVPLPATAVMVPPPQEPVSPLGVAIVRPAGKASVNAMPVSEVDEFGLAIVKRRLVDPPTAMLGAPKDFVSDGGAATMSDAEAVLPVPPLVEVTAPVMLL